MTLTSMPVLALNNGRIWPNNPVSCVDVVEATTMDLSCAADDAVKTVRETRASSRRRVSMRGSLLRLDKQFAADEFLGLRRAGKSKEVFCGPGFGNASAMQQNDIAGQTPRFAEIMRGHHHLDAARRDIADHVLDHLG